MQRALRNGLKRAGQHPVPIPLPPKHMPHADRLRQVSGAHDQVRRERPADPGSLQRREGVTEDRGCFARGTANAANTVLAGRVRDKRGLPGATRECLRAPATRRVQAASARCVQTPCARCVRSSSARRVCTTTPGVKRCKSDVCMVVANSCAIPVYLYLFCRGTLL